MYTNELDNNILKNQLTKKFPHKVNLGIFDDGKIKGVDKFPVYDATKGFTSHAKPEMYHVLFSKQPTTKYNVSKPSHTPVGKIQPNYFNENQSSLRPKRNKFAMKSGEMSNFFGIPCGRDIVLENPTAQAMNMMGGKMTEDTMKIHNWHKEEQTFDKGVDLLGFEEFIHDTRTQEIIHGTLKNKGHLVASDDLTEPPTLIDNGKKKGNGKKISKLFSPKNMVVVEPAFSLNGDLLVNDIKKSTEKLSSMDDIAPLQRPPPPKPTSKPKYPTIQKSLPKSEPKLEDIYEGKEDFTSSPKTTGEKKLNDYETPKKNELNLKHELNQYMSLINIHPGRSDDDAHRSIKVLMKSLGYELPHGNIKNNLAFYNAVQKKMGYTVHQL